MQDLFTKVSTHDILQFLQECTEALEEHFTYLLVLICYYLLLI